MQHQWWWWWWRWCWWGWSIGRLICKHPLLETYLKQPAQCSNGPFFLFKIKIEFILCLISGQAAVGVKSLSSQPLHGETTQRDQVQLMTTSPTSVKCKVPLWPTMAHNAPSQRRLSNNNISGLRNVWADINIAVQHPTCRSRSVRDAVCVILNIWLNKKAVLFTLFLFWFCFMNMLSVL